MERQPAEALLLLSVTPCISIKEKSWHPRAHTRGLQLFHLGYVFSFSPASFSPVFIPVLCHARHSGISLDPAAEFSRQEPAPDEVHTKKIEVG